MINDKTESLKKDFLLANTATQLYSWFRKHRILYDLAKQENKKDIIKEFNRISKKKEKTIDDVVKLYAILVSITFYPYNESIEIFSKLNISKLSWADDIIDIYKREATITIYTMAQGKALIQKHEKYGKKISSSDSYNEFNVTVDK